MRSRILVTAFLVLGFAAAGTLTARGVAGACDNGCCAANDTGCCADDMTCCAMSKADASLSSVTRDKQWSIVNFMNTVRVGKAFVAGPVLIVHDAAKMARGEPCTTFYRFDPKSGPKEALVSFHCKPRRASAVETTTVSGVIGESGVRQLTEYQIAGDTEAHGIPW